MVAQDHYFVLGRGFRYFVFSHLPEEDHPIWPAFSSKLGWFNHQLDPTSHLRYIFCYSKSQLKNQLFQRNLRLIKFTLSNIPIGHLAALGVFFPFSPSFFVCQTQLRGNSQQPRCEKRTCWILEQMGSEVESRRPWWMSGGKVGGSLDLRRQKLGATPLKTNEGPLKINGWRMYSLLKQSIFRGHVSFLGCRYSKPWRIDGSEIPRPTTQHV